MESIKKASQISSYQKETNDLKADNLKENLTNSNKKWEKGVSSRHGSENLSWRKNSNQQSVNSGDLG
jgi:hypothetical protein